MKQVIYDVYPAETQWGERWKVRTPSAGHEAFEYPSKDRAVNMALELASYDFDENGGQETVVRVLDASGQSVEERRFTQDPGDSAISYDEDPFHVEVLPEFRAQLDELEAQGVGVEARADVWRKAYAEAEPTDRHHMRIVAWEAGLAEATAEDWQTDDVTELRDFDFSEPHVGIGASQFYRGARMAVDVRRHIDEDVWDCSAMLQFQGQPWEATQELPGFPDLASAYAAGMARLKDQVDARRGLPPSR